MSTSSHPPPPPGLLAALARQEDDITAELGVIDSRLAHVRSWKNDYDSAINRLPPEVLSNIFLSGLAMQHHSSMRRNRMPLNVTQVSLRWRNAAISTPALWSQVRLLGRTDWFGPRGALVDAWLVSQLARTKAVPIDIIIRPGWQINTSPEAITRTQVLLAPHFVRCRRLELASEKLEFYRVLLSACLVDMPLLEELSVRMTPESPRFYFGTHASLCRIPLPTTMRRLKNLTLQRVVLQLCADDTTVQNLSTLRLDYAYLIQSYPARLPEDELHAVQMQSLSVTGEREQEPLRLNMLQKAVNLESMSLHGVRMRYRSTGESVEFAKLRYLYFSWLQRDDTGIASFTVMFEQIDMPSLRVLHIVVPQSEDAHDRGRPADVDLFLSRSAGRMPALESLFLLRAAFSAHVFLTFLEMVPLLRVLHLIECTVSIELLDGLSWDRSPRVCPALRELDISRKVTKPKVDIPYRPFTVPSLERLLRSRNRDEARLSKLIIHGGPTLKASIEHCVKEYVTRPGLSRTRGNSSDTDRSYTDDSQDALNLG